MKLRSNKTAVKRVMSVFLCALTLLSCWVFFAPMKANAGGGKYKICFDFYDNDNGTNGSSITTKYKTKDDNGNGSESGELPGPSYSGKITKKQHIYQYIDNQNFPSYFYAKDVCSDGQYPELRLRVYVAKAGTTNYDENTSGWLRVCDFEFHHKNLFESNTGYASTTTIDNKPAASSVSLGSSTEQSVTVPKSGTAFSTTSTSATVKDQYGVNWYQSASWAVNSSNTAVTTSDTTLTNKGVSVGTGCVNVTNATKDLLGSDHTKTIYLNAYFGSLKTGCIPVTITNVQYDVTWSWKETNTSNPASPTTKTTTAEKVFYQNTPNAPTGKTNSYYDENNHYTNGSFSPSAISGDTTFNMSYTTTTHTYGNPTWTVSGDKATAKYTCSGSCGYNFTKSNIISIPDITEKIETTDISTTYESLTDVIGISTGAPTSNNAKVLNAEPAHQTTAIGNYGTMSVSGGKATYTVTSMKFTDVDTFWLVRKIPLSSLVGHNITGTYAYAYEKITVVPARSLYYEDNFNGNDRIHFDNSTSSTTGSYGKWTTKNVTGTAMLAAESAEAIMPQNDNVASYSGGSTHAVSVADINNGDWPSATFTFAGTGFDVVSLTDSNSGVFVVSVYKGSDTSGERVEYQLVDTYYGYAYGQVYKDANGKKTLDPGTEANPNKPMYKSTKTITDGNGNTYASGEVSNSPTYYDANGNITKEVTDKPAYAFAWLKTENADNAMYQVPTISIDDLPYGTYTVKVEARFTDIFRHYNTDGDGVKYYDLCFDAIRIHNPAGNSSIYGENEQCVTFEQINKQTLTSGAILIDGNAIVPVSELDSFTEAMPNNELYLAAGQSIAFTLDCPSFTKLELGMRAADAKASSAVIKYGSTQITKQPTAKEQYFTLTGIANGNTVLITNTGSGILALSKLRISSASEAANPANAPRMTVNSQTAPKAMLMLAMDLDEPLTETEPVETTEETTTEETTEPVTEETTEDVTEETTEKTTTEVTEPETEPTEPKPEPTETTEDKGDDEAPAKLSIIRRIINFFKELFRKIFK